MQQLHLVGFTADNRGLIFSPRKGSKSGGFVVDLDDRLLARVDEVIARREEEDGARSNRPSSNLSPREIQARLRAGRSIAQVAREAGVEEEWVARWAAPIQAEQGQVVQRAQALILQKNRVGPSAVELGEAVRWNMADKGIVFTDAGWSGSWDAFHLREDSWVVRFSYVHRKRTNQAEWEVDIPSGSLTSRNRQGTELGYVAPGRKRPKPPRTTLVNPAPPAPVTPASKPEPAPKPEPKKPAKRRRPAAKKSPAKKSPAKKSPAKKSPAKARKEEPGQEEPGQEEPGQEEPAKKSPPKRVLRPARAPSRRVLPGQRVGRSHWPPARRPGRPRPPSLQPASLQPRAFSPEWLPLSLFR